MSFNVRFYFWLFERMVESIVPWLVYNPSCSSVIELQNLGDREVAAEVEAHKSSGALAPLMGHSGNSVRLSPGERAEYEVQLAEETDGAWVRIREKIPSPQLSPVLAVSGASECVAENKLHTTVRDVAWPMRNPGFSGDVKSGDDGIIALINVSERPVSVWGCYSSGSLYSVPRNDRPAELMPLLAEYPGGRDCPADAAAVGDQREGVPGGLDDHFRGRSAGAMRPAAQLRPQKVAVVAVICANCGERVVNDRGIERIRRG